MSKKKEVKFQDYDLESLGGQALKVLEGLEGVHKDLEKNDLTLLYDWSNKPGRLYDLNGALKELELLMPKAEDSLLDITRRLIEMNEDNFSHDSVYKANTESVSLSRYVTVLGKLLKWIERTARMLNNDSNRLWRDINFSTRHYEDAIYLASRANCVHNLSAFEAHLLLSYSMILQAFYRAGMKYQYVSGSDRIWYLVPEDDFWCHTRHIDTPLREYVDIDNMPPHDKSEVGLLWRQAYRPLTDLNGHSVSKQLYFYGIKKVADKLDYPESYVEALYNVYRNHTVTLFCAHIYNAYNRPIDRPQPGSGSLLKDENWERIGCRLRFNPYNQIFNALYNPMIKTIRNVLVSDEDEETGQLALYIDNILYGDRGSGESLDKVMSIKFISACIGDELEDKNLYTADLLDFVYFDVLRKIIYFD